MEKKDNILKDMSDYKQKKEFFIKLLHIQNILESLNFNINKNTDTNLLNLSFKFDQIYNSFKKEINKFIDNDCLNKLIQLYNNSELKIFSDIGQIENSDNFYEKINNAVDFLQDTVKQLQKVSEQKKLIDVSQKREDIKYSPTPLSLIHI